MKFISEQLALLESETGPGRLMILRVDDDEIAVRRLDAAEWAALQEASEGNPDWQALALQRAVVGYAGCPPEQTAARVAELLAEDPQIGDALGAQLVAAAGHRAQVRAELGAGRAVTMRVRLDLPGGPSWSITGQRPGPGQWSDIRRAVSKGGPTAGALRCYELCVPAPPDLALYPALPAQIGMTLMNTTKRRVGDPSL